MATPEDMLQEMMRLAAQQAQQAQGGQVLIEEEDDDDREYVGDYEDDGEDYDEVAEGKHEGEDGEEEEEGLEEDAEEGEFVEGEEEDGDGGEDQGEYIRGLEPLQGEGGGEVEVEEEEEEAAGGDAWRTLATLPAPTQKAFVDLLGQLRDSGRDELTVLLMGKGGVGKSSTLNSLFAEKLANVAAFQTDPSPPQLFRREAAGFALQVVDTPSLVDGDTINEQAVDALVSAVEELGGVDVLLYLDRLDSHRVEPQDKELLGAITSALGRDVWLNTVLGLTRAEVAPPAGMSYEDFVDRRGAGLRAAIRASGAPADAALPLVLVENSSKCTTDAAGQKVLPDGRPWLPMMMSEVVDVALAADGPFVFDERARRAANPNNKRKWLIPLVLLAQVALKVFVLDRILEEDRITGDQYGPYDKEYVAEERARIRAEKEEAKAAKRRAAARRAAGKSADASDSSSSSDEEDEEAVAGASRRAAKAARSAKAAAAKAASAAAQAAVKAAGSDDDDDDGDDDVDGSDDE